MAQLRGNQKPYSNAEAMPAGDRGVPNPARAIVLENGAVHTAEIDRVATALVFGPESVAGAANGIR